MSEVPKPVPKELKELDRQFTEHLDSKIVKNLVMGTEKSQAEAIRTTATRIFSMDEHKVSTAVNRYQIKAEKHRRA